MMVVLLHDLAEEMGSILLKRSPEAGTPGLRIYANDGTVHQCIGCEEECGLGSPGKCVFKDEGTDFADDLLLCSELIIVSAMTYGSVSPFIKTMLDRAHPILNPALELKNGKVSYRCRVKTPFSMHVYFYGPRNAAYEATAMRFLKQIQAEWRVSELVVRFTEDPAQIGGIV